MSELSGLQIFKYLPGADKKNKSEFANCKKCGCPTCMAFALKLAKKQIESEKCPHVCDELAEIIAISQKQPQKTLQIGGLKIGGEDVLYRHEKTFINKTAIAVVVDCSEANWQDKLHRMRNFEITRMSETFKVDLVIFKNGAECNLDGINTITFDEFMKLPIEIIIDDSFKKTAANLINTRIRAVIEKDDAYSNPVGVYFKHTDNSGLCARAGFYLCKYANILIFEDFDESVISALRILRQNIFTDPQKPLQIESGIYEFNEPDENSLIFMTTNFALTYFAVANELEKLNIPSYLMVIPANGMSVLTAWSAEKFTAQIAAKTLKKFGLANKIKNRKIIIPGLLAHMQNEFEEELPEFEIIVGTNEAHGIKEFITKISF